MRGRQCELIARDLDDRDRRRPVLVRPGEGGARRWPSVQDLDAEESVRDLRKRVTGGSAGVARHRPGRASNRERPGRLHVRFQCFPRRLTGRLRRRGDPHAVADARPGAGVGRRERGVDQGRVLGRLHVLLEDVEEDENVPGRRQSVDLVLRQVRELGRVGGEHAVDPDRARLDPQVERAARRDRHLEGLTPGRHAGRADRRGRSPLGRPCGRVNVEVRLVVEQHPPRLHPRAGPALVATERNLRVVAGHHSSQGASSSRGRMPSGTNSCKRVSRRPRRAARRRWW